MELQCHVTIVVKFELSLDLVMMSRLGDFFWEEESTLPKTDSLE